MCVFIAYISKSDLEVHQKYELK